ncbi:MAG: glycosyltransferase family 2 protein [Bryobacterales bacterium]|nr:glycosyltransferase family 2 protein [Bryobacterales bacterium]
MHAESRKPDLSLVMPCYNEERAVAYTVWKLLVAFQKSGYRLEIVAVDNGSQDRTGEILRSLARRDPSVVPVRVERNQGYGHGILQGIPYCTAPWVGNIPADGQVDAEDVVRLYEVAASTSGDVVAKVRRRFRMDGFRRKIVSISYNALVRLLWPGLGSIDVNGCPKILPRAVVLAMGLKSKDWFLDPEIMIKAHYMGLRVLELNTFARMRGHGLSHVRTSTCWEFLRNLARYRFTQSWKADLRPVTEPGIKPSVPMLETEQTA